MGAFMQLSKRLFGPLLTFLVLFSSTLFAQTNTTSLTGEVTDATGAAIQGASITITDAGSGFHAEEVSKSKGEYSFEQLKPGNYEVKVSYPGFSEQLQKVQLLIATPLKLAFKLTAGSSEVVNVETTLVDINSTDATLGKAFESKQIRDLPYQANNVLSLLSLQPGVLSMDGGAQTGGINTDTRTGIVNGARQDQTNIALDGVDNNDQNNGFAFTGVLRATRESVEEFRVTTSNANADAGRSSGAQVSLVTRSGTDHLHGSAYEYYRGSATASNDWYIKQSQLASGNPNVAPKILQHTYGAAFGAPIIPDKFFFFGAYEGFKQASNVPVIQTVPSLLGGGGLVSGNVSYLNQAGNVVTLHPADIAKMDPNCTTSCPNGRGTDAAALAYYAKFPAANGNLGDGYNTGSYAFTSPQPIHQITNIVRLDYALNNRHAFFLRGNLQSDNTTSTLQFPGQPANSSVYGNNKGIAAGYIWSISSNLTNNFRYGFSRQGVATRGAGSQPHVSVSGISSLTSTTTSSVYIVPVNNFIDDFTWNKGRHTFQVGINIRALTDNRYADSTLYPTASVSATLLATAAIAGKGISLDPGAFGFDPVGSNFTTQYNNAILANTGVITSATQYTNYALSGNSLNPVPTGTVPTHNYQSLEQEYYLQDQYKITSRLTLTAGLRYTYLGVPYETNGQQVAPSISLDDFLKARIAAANSGSAYTTRMVIQPAGQANNAPNLWTPQKTNFAPRFAFAYSTPDNKTSVRGGWSLAYDHFGEGVVNYYDANGAFALSTATTGAYTNSDTAPRFTGYNNVPLQTIAAGSRPFPITPADQNFSFVRSVNSHLKTPYAEMFNLTLQREVGHGLTLTGSYVGRLGRHILSNLDVAQPVNFVDPGSGMSYYAAATVLDKLIDQGVTTGNVPNMPFFQDVFPNAKKTVAGVTYTGTKAFYQSLLGSGRGNETDTLFTYDLDPTASPSGQTFRFFYPQYSSVYAQSSVGTSNYNGLQLSARHVLRYGLEYDVNYTFSKSMDLGSSPERTASNSLLNTFNPAGNYAVSDFDVRHNFTANYSLPVPFGRGAPFASDGNGLVDGLIGGWALNGLVHYSSGFPFSATSSGRYGTNFDVSSFMVQTAPIHTGGHVYQTGVAPYETAIHDITSTQANARLRPAYVGETGQRNNFRADGYFSVDGGLSKIFHIGEKQQFRISTEVFNMLNDVRFGAITTNGLSNKFGQYTGVSTTSTGAPGSSTTTAATLVAPRQMQFSGKYTF
jgi:hypothetical protein